MMAVSTALSGYSAVFFTMEVYYVKRLADEGGADQQLRLETFLTLVGYRRKSPATRPSSPSHWTWWPSAS